jgi:lysine 2,3-aminomutase
MSPPAARLLALPRTARTLGADDLVPAGLVAPERAAGIAAVADRYAVAVTPAMAALIDPDDPADPIARQFIPDMRELATVPGERADPIGDAAHSPVEGIVHRYPDRVLLKPVHVCAVYCRFCFRREMVGPGADAVLAPEALERALAYVRAHPEVWEVVVTGGDPLVMSPRRVAELTSALQAIPHVAVVRWHTRVPVVAPERVDAALVAALRGGAGAATWVSIHANHPRELTDAARAACARLADAGIPLVSQTVLLKGVNDDVETLSALMRAFVACRIKPYYLHQGDMAPGTSHMRTTLQEGRALVKALRGRLSGLCQPTYVLDIPGGYGKAPVGPDALSSDGQSVEDWRGRSHPAPPT